MHLSHKDIAELRTFFTILHDEAQEQMGQTQDIQEFDAHDERSEYLRKWITRLRFAGVDTLSLKHLLRTNKDNGPFDEYLLAVQKEVQRREEED